MSMLTGLFALHIDLAMVRVMMRDIAREFPDRLGMLEAGQGCAYVSEVQNYRLTASCIVGVMFERLGILRVLMTNTCEAPNAHHNNVSQLGSISGDEVRGHLSQFGIGISDEAWDFLILVQGAQDNEEEWGRAVPNAERRYLEQRDRLPLSIERAFEREAEEFGSLA